MRKFEDRKQIRSRVYSKTTLIILLIVIILTARGIFTLYLRNQESFKARDNTSKKVMELRDRKGLLSNEIDKLNQEDGIDQEIREKFNVTKPGENVVLIVPDEVATTTEVKVGFFAKLWHWIW